MKLEEVKKFGVIGAGQMGGGIAQIAAQSGYEVLLSDADMDRAEQGKTKIAKLLDRQVDKGRLERVDADDALHRITAIADVSGFADADIVVESATENFDLKVKIFRGADEAMKPGALLASNTSSISITKLAAATSRPSLVCGMHFMNPVPLRKLCEIVRGPQTDEETSLTVKTLAEKMGKTTITSQDHPGFLVNRVLIPLLNEACHTLQEGVGSAEDIDTGCKLGLNHPMGPLELSDLIGLDTVLAIAEVLHTEIGDPKYRPATILRNYVAAGWLGRKAGRGFYQYDERGKRAK